MDTGAPMPEGGGFFTAACDFCGGKGYLTENEFQQFLSSSQDGESFEEPPSELPGASPGTPVGDT